MVKKIKKLDIVLTVLFLAVFLLIAVLSIWNIIDGDLAQEAITKVAYTFGAILGVSIVVILITKKTD